MRTREQETKSEVGVLIDVFFFFFNFIFFGRCRVFVAEHRLSLVAASGGYSSLWCTGFSLGGFSCCRARALGAWDSVVAARRL